MLNTLKTVWLSKSKILLTTGFVLKCQSSCGINWLLDFQGPLPKVGTDNPEGPLSVSGGLIVFGVNSVEDGGG